MNKKAFTLLELLVVVLIIGILTGIALPQYKKAVLRSKFAAIKDKTRAIYNAEQRYYLINNTYTTNWNNLDITNISSNCNINSPSNYIFCNLTDKKGNILSQYIIMTRTNQLRCDAFGEKNNLPNKICQLETNKPQTNNCTTTYCTYYY